jgi:hypothetical protein
MDTTSIVQAQNLLGNLLFFAMRQPNARSKFDFKYVSADWIDLPGWFFWPKSRPGVFLLKLKDIQTNDAAGIIDTDYRLSYYPALSEPLFEKYSCEEQLVRSSAHFSSQGVAFATECPHCECIESAFADLSEGKGIPTLEARQNMKSELFNVGKLSLHWETEKLTRIAMTAPHCDRTHAETVIEITTDSGPIRLLEIGEIDRELPCWDIAAAFVRSLVEFLPVRVGRHSGCDAKGKNGRAIYRVSQTCCRTTGIAVE